jgi:hypothetical protein
MPHRPPTVPQRLLARLDDVGRVLAGQDDTVALLAVGSVGLDLHRLDEHSDLDFFVVVDEGAKARYHDDIGWLAQLGPVEFAFPNSTSGRTLRWADGIFAEYAVFTVPELRAIAYPPGRVVWQRADAPPGLETPVQPLRPALGRCWTTSTRRCPTSTSACIATPGANGSPRRG